MAASEGVSAALTGSTVVVTGAAGFIGGRLAERLVRDYGAKVRCLVRDRNRAKRLAGLSVDIVEADLADGTAIDNAVRGANYVFHCAYDHRSREQNVESTRNLIEASLKHQAERLVYVSTMSVYEPLPDGPLSEATRDGDRGWAYTRNKLDLERMVLDAVDERGLPGTIVQPAVVYGPHCKPWTDAPAEMLLWGEVILPGSGEGLCNAVYIDDLVDGLLLAATKRDAIGERFLVSGPAPVTWGEFYGAFAQALGTNGPTYWPAERIAATTGGLLNKIKLVAENPKRLAGLAMRFGPARRAIEAGIGLLPKTMKERVLRPSGPPERKLGEVFVPGSQQLALYSAKASIDGGKARRLLGYAPKFDLAAGMVPTRDYLEETYGALRTKLRALRNSGNEPRAVSQVDLANAD